MAKPSGVGSINPALRGKTCMGIFGNPGIGKTRLVSTSANPLIIHPPTDHLDSITEARGEHIVVRDMDDMDQVYEWLRELTPQDCPYDWVWLDSVSLLQDHIVDAIHADVVASKPHRKNTPVDVSEWGLETRSTGAWFRHMVALAKDYNLFNFGFTAHAAELPLPPEDDLIFLPAVRGKNMPSKLCGYMNIVGYMEVKDNVRVLRTQASDRYYAKDQYDAWPDGRVIEPTMPKIMKAIQAARPTAAAPVRRGARRRRAAAA